MNEVRCVVCGGGNLFSEAVPRYLQSRDFSNIIPEGNCHFCWGPMVIETHYAPIPSSLLWGPREGRTDGNFNDPTWTQPYWEGGV